MLIHQVCYNALSGLKRVSDGVYFGSYHRFNVTAMEPVPLTNQPYAVAYPHSWRSIQAYKDESVVCTWKTESDYSGMRFMLELLSIPIHLSASRGIINLQFVYKQPSSTGTTQELQGLKPDANNQVSSTIFKNVCIYVSAFEW